MAASWPAREIQCLIVDTGPLIKNDPPVSSLLAKATEIFTIPAVLDEIRDEATRARIQTTLVPFLKLRNPKAASIKFVTEFARKTGDLVVLSRPDIHLLALAYELECERNHGDWRLRSTPGQKELNGRPPNETATEEGHIKQTDSTTPSGDDDAAIPAGAKTDSAAETLIQDEKTPEERKPETEAEHASTTPGDSGTATETVLETGLLDLKLESRSDSSSSAVLEPSQTTAPLSSVESREEEAALDKAQVAQASRQDGIAVDDDDDEGWIVPNWGRETVTKASSESTEPAEPMQVALLTSDYAMQNVSLRMNLNILSPQMSRIRQLKTWVLRCHGCFKVTRDMSKQFCPSCGQPTLLRTSCTTAADGSFTIHLKRNFQWNTRGNVYSIPKPVSGSASGKVKGGGKNGWGQDLVLAEDQKEYVRRMDDARRATQKDLMDPDAVFLSGPRDGAGHGRIRIGAGRNINAKSRR